MSLCNLPLMTQAQAKPYSAQVFPFSLLPHQHHHRHSLKAPQSLNLGLFSLRSKAKPSWGSSISSLGDKFGNRAGTAAQAYFGVLRQFSSILEFSKRHIKEKEIVKVNEKKEIVKEVETEVLTLARKIEFIESLQTLPGHYQLPVCENIFMQLIGKVVMVKLTSDLEYKGYVVSVDSRSSSLLLRDAEEFFQGKRTRSLGEIRCDKFMSAYLPKNESSPSSLGRLNQRWD